MPLTTAQIAQLKSELTTDPTGLGLTALYTAGNDQGAADALNLRRATVTIRRADIAAKELWEAIDVADMTALPASPTAAQLSTERRQLAWLSGLPNIGALRLLNDDGTNAPPVANLVAMFAAGTLTRTRITALGTRQGSRAEQLFGRDVAVSADDIARARQS